MLTFFHQAVLNYLASVSSTPIRKALVEKKQACGSGILRKD
jgi:hypothetical protein